MSILEREAAVSARAEDLERAETYPVSVVVRPSMEGRNRLTTAFRFFLAIPHLLLVGGPVAAGTWVFSGPEHGINWGWGPGAGLLGLVACFAAAFAWVAILVTGRHPDALWRTAAFYLRWRVRAISYLMLLRDEYPPFGDSEYPAELVMQKPGGTRDRLTVAFRFFLALPHLIVLWLLSLVWALTTATAWVLILFTGRYPETLYGFGMGVLAWDVRVEAYLLLVRDEYPPFTLRT